jgi:hypothetical protein
MTTSRSDDGDDEHAGAVAEQISGVPVSLAAEVVASFFLRPLVERIQTGGTLERHDVDDLARALVEIDRGARREVERELRDALARELGIDGRRPVLAELLVLVRTYRETHGKLCEEVERLRRDSLLRQ